MHQELFASYNERHTAAGLRIDKKIYSKGALLRTCYSFARDLTFQISDQEDSFDVKLALQSEKPSLLVPVVKKIDEYIPDFLNSLVDNQLRIEIQAETAAVRELIIAKAFAESGILEDAPPGTFEDPVLSPKTGDSLVKIANAHGN